MRIRATRIRNCDYRSHTLFKSPSHNLNRIQLHSNILREKVHCSQVSNGNRNRLDHKSFYQSKLERLLHNPEDCKNELQRLKIITNECANRKLVKFQVFSDSAHQAELERYQGYMKLDDK